MQDFVHLHVHTQYSILDGQASIPRLVDKAMADGMKGIAVTDHGDMFGIKEFFNYVNKKNSSTNGEIKDLKKRIAGLEKGFRFGLHEDAVVVAFLSGYPEFIPQDVDRTHGYYSHAVGTVSLVFLFPMETEIHERTVRVFRLA